MIQPTGQVLIINVDFDVCGCYVRSAIQKLSYDLIRWRFGVRYVGSCSSAAWRIDVRRSEYSSL